MNNYYTNVDRNQINREELGKVWLWEYEFEGAHEVMLGEKFIVNDTNIDYNGVLMILIDVENITYLDEIF